MKRTLVLALSLLSITSFGQGSKAPGGVSLKKGMVITVVSTMDQKTDMGMAGEMSSNGGGTSTIAITDADATSYKFDFTMTKMKMNMDMMGNSTSYDSEKPNDPENEMTKSMGDKIGKAEKGSVDIMSGKVTMDAKEEEGEENPMKALMGGGDNTSSAGGAFFVIPAGKGTGDSWTSTNDGDSSMKSSTTYKITSMDKDVANIDFETNGNINKEVEMQGMQLTMNMSTKSTGKMSVNTSAGVLISRNETSEIDGTMDVMGQSTPINVKSTSSANYSMQ